MKGFTKVVALFFLVSAAWAAPEAVILSASATSSSKDSTSVLALLDPQAQGHWSPDSKDFGTDEGIYLQFAQPVPMDYIEVVFKGEPSPNSVKLECYINGKTSNPDDKLEFAAGEIAYHPSHSVFRIYRRSLTNEKFDKPLGAKVRSFFFKIQVSAVVDAPPIVVTSIRFKGPSGLIPVKLPVLMPAKITASSILEPTQAYDPSYLFDSRLDFAWSTNGKATSGIGESLRFDLQEPQNLSGIILWNGYQRSEVHYRANCRVSALALSADGGAPQTLQVPDKMGPATLLFPAPLTKAKSLKLQITGIYPGDKYKDVLISEMRFLDPDKNIILPQVDFPVPAVSGQQEPFLGQTWASFLGYSTRTGDAGSRLTNTLRLRRNGTFVFYLNGNGWVIMDGNWAPTDTGFRIFGKKYTPSYQASIYLNTLQGNNYGIFESQVVFKKYSALPFSERKKILEEFIDKYMGNNEDEALNETKSWDWIFDRFKSESDDVKLTGSSKKELVAKADIYLMKRNDVYLIDSSVYRDLVVPLSALANYIESYE